MQTGCAWHALGVEQVIAALDTSYDGLSTYEAAVRLQRHGRNLLARTRRTGPLRLIARQFENPLALVLLGSGLLAHLFGSATDSAVILWVNFVTGVTLSLPLAWERSNGHLMSRSPRSRDQPLFGRDLLVRCVLVGVVMAAGAIGLFLWQFDEVRPLADTELALRKAQTMAVTTVVLYQVFYLFQCRSLQISALRLDAANPGIYLGVGVTLAMHSAFVYARPMHELFHSAALGPAEWLLSAATAASVVPAVALHKWLTRRRAPIRRAG